MKTTNCVVAAHFGFIVRSQRVAVVVSTENVIKYKT